MPLNKDVNTYILGIVIPILRKTIPILTRIIPRLSRIIPRISRIIPVHDKHGRVKLPFT